MLTHGDSVNHDSDSRNTPTHDERADAQVLLESGSEGDEADDVEHGPDVASPGRPQS